MTSEQFPLRTITDNFTEETIENRREFLRREKSRTLNILIAVSVKFFDDPKQCDEWLVHVAHEFGLSPQQEANA